MLKAKKSSWGKILSLAVLAILLVASHAYPVPAMPEMPKQAQHHCPDMPSPAPMQKHLPPASCQACPGMALFLPEPMKLPLRVAIGVFAQPISSEMAGIIPILDTPPPRSFVEV